MILSRSRNCSLIGNAAFSNERGISLKGSDSCFLQANNASANKIDGISLQQLSEAENDVMAGKMSMRQVQTQITAYEKILGYGTAVGTTALI